MTVPVLTVITRAANQLNDAGFNRYTQAELLDYINEGQFAAAVIKPDIASKNADVTLVAGTRQTIPSDGFQLLDVVCNVVGGAEDRAIRIVERAGLDALNPNWRLPGNANTPVKNYIFEGREPLNFYVVPPQPSSGMSTVRIVYAQIPPNIADSTGNISLPDIYAPMLVDYALFRTFSKDTEADGIAELAQAAYGRFTGALGVKEATERRDDPNRGMTGFNAADPASNK